MNQVKMVGSEQRAPTTRDRILPVADSPRVSIGLPVYNGERFLEKALNSLLMQTFRDIELIISDNGSTDRTEAICRAFASRDQRIRYYRRNDNLGAAWNYNRVFELASGRYFRWAAADDICAPEMLERYVEVLDGNPHAALCYAKTIHIDEDDRILDYYDDRLNLTNMSASERFIQFYFSISECNAFYGLMRPECLRRTRPMGKYLHSDRNLLAELCLYGQFIEIPDRLFGRRIHPGAHSSRPIEERQYFFDLAMKDRIVFPRSRCLLEDVVSIGRAPIGVHRQALLFAFLGFRTLRAPRRYIRDLSAAFKQWLYPLRVRWFPTSIHAATFCDGGSEQSERRSAGGATPGQRARRDAAERGKVLSFAVAGGNLSTEDVASSCSPKSSTLGTMTRSDAS